MRGVSFYERNFEMKRYFDYLLHEMFPALFRGVAKFVGETLIFVRTYFWVILVVLAVLYFADIGGMKGEINGWISTVKGWFK